MTALDHLLMALYFAGMLAVAAFTAVRASRARHQADRACRLARQADRTSIKVAGDADDVAIYSAAACKAAERADRVAGEFGRRLIQDAATRATARPPADPHVITIDSRAGCPLRLAKFDNSEHDIPFADHMRDQGFDPAACNDDTE